MQKKSAYKKLTDYELFELMKKSNHKAFTELYYRYSTMLFGLSLKYLKDKMMAEDAVQYCFVKLWEARKKITVTKNVKNYLYTLVKNHILNQMRTNSKAILQSYQDAQIIETYSNNTTIEKEETVEQFYKALEKLPERKKEVCLLKMNEQFTNKEIAEMLNISVSTVKTHFAQSKEMLKLQLKKVLFFLILIIFS